MDADVLPIHNLLPDALVLTAIVPAWRLCAGRNRCAYTRGLDAADAFEAWLRIVRTQIGRDDGDPVREALQGRRRQRPWLQRHGARSGVAAPDGMRDPIGQTQVRVHRQLAQVRAGVDACIRH